MDSALPSFARRQQLRDEYFSFHTDVDRKQFIKDTFLFGFQVSNFKRTDVCFMLINFSFFFFFFAILKYCISFAVLIRMMMMLN